MWHYLWLRREFSTTGGAPARLCGAAWAEVYAVAGVGAGALSLKMATRFSRC